MYIALDKEQNRIFIDQAVQGDIFFCPVCLEEMKKRNEKKAALLYDYLDGQDYYKAPVRKESRSMMNVTFVTGDADLDKKFASEAAAEGLKNLKGHRSVGGMRASIYNAMPYEGVEKLVAFMKEFAARNPK